MSPWGRLSNQNCPDHDSLYLFENVQLPARRGQETLIHAASSFFLFLFPFSFIQVETICSAPARITFSCLPGRNHGVKASSSLSLSLSLPGLLHRLRTLRSSHNNSTFWRQGLERRHNSGRTQLFFSPEMASSMMKLGRQTGPRVMGYAQKRAMATAMHTESLPDLDYDYGALEPVISGEIMKLHHQKHHQTYITNFNKALEQLQAAKDPQTIVGLQSAINFNGGGMGLHYASMFLATHAVSHPPIWS